MTKKKKKKKRYYQRLMSYKRFKMKTDERVKKENCRVFKTWNLKF